MTLDDIIAYCLAKPGAYADHPFSPFFPVIKVKALSQAKGRIFAQPFVLRGEAKVTLNCTPASAAYYRAAYPGAVVRGWHCPPVQQPHFNTVTLNGAVPDDALIRMMDHAWETVVAKYPKYIQTEIRAIGGCRIFPNRVLVRRSWDMLYCTRFTVPTPTFGKDQ